MALIQLAVPAKWIYDHEKVLKEGTPYKFRLEPVDPGDPFRGNYLTLNYSATSYKVDDPGEWEKEESVYARIDTNSEGFVRLVDISHSVPENGPYFRTSIRYIRRNHDSEKASLELEHPFDCYYLPKDRAQKVEGLLFRRDSLPEGPNYGLVRILDGKASLEDVVVQGKPVDRIIEE